MRGGSGAARFPVGRSRRRGAEGFTLVELLVGMTATLLIMAIIPPVFETIMASTGQSGDVVSGADQARLAFENLEGQVASADQVCLPTQISNSISVASGFGLRAEVATQSGTEWDQWYLNASSGQLWEERDYTPPENGNPSVEGNWQVVATSLANSSASPPFAFLTTAQGSPQSVSIDLVVEEADGSRKQVVELRSAVAAFDVSGTTTTTSTSTTTTTVPATTTTTTTPSVPTCSAAEPSQ